MRWARLEVTSGGVTMPMASRVNTPGCRRGTGSLSDLALRYVEHSLRANRRGDALYHAYNILRLDGETASIGHLYEMLEGQVAVLSSGLLSGAESLMPLRKSLRHSPLYRPDQNSYILYPDRPVQDFLAKNSMTADQVGGLALVAATGQSPGHEPDQRGSGRGLSLQRADPQLEGCEPDSGCARRKPRYEELVKAEAARIKTLFEAVFHHDEFTGRSGTFFAYEGLGSIYWHMMSKLLLAVQETILRTRGEPSTQGIDRKIRRDAQRAVLQ